MLTVVFVLPALEASTFLGLVVPDELAVLAGGVVAHGGALTLWAVVLAAATGAAVGAASASASVGATATGCWITCRRASGDRASSTGPSTSSAGAAPPRS